MLTILHDEEEKMARKYELKNKTRFSKDDLNVPGFRTSGATSFSSATTELQRILDDSRNIRQRLNCVIFQSEEPEPVFKAWALKGN